MERTLVHLGGGATILRETPSRGLGDAVSSVAQPIAKVIDYVAGTDIQHCKSCDERRKKLNELFRSKNLP